MTSPSSWSKMGPMKGAVLLLTTLVHLSTAQSKLCILCSGCVCVCEQYTAINVYNLYIHRVACPEITVHSRAFLAEFSPAWLLFRSMCYMWVELPTPQIIHACGMCYSSSIVLLQSQ